MCTAFSVCPWSLPSGCPWSDGPSRSWPRQSEKSGKQASYGVSGRRRGVGVGSYVLGQAFPIGETARRRLVSEASAPVLRSERWAEEVNERVLVPLGRPSGRRPDCPSGPLCFRLLGRPMNYMLFSWAEPWCGSRSPRDPGFMNPIGAPEPSGDLSRIVRGIFLSCRWVRASAPTGVAPEPSGSSG